MVEILLTKFPFVVVAAAVVHGITGNLQSIIAAFRYL